MFRWFTKYARLLFPYVTKEDEFIWIFSLLCCQSHLKPLTQISFFFSLSSHIILLTWVQTFLVTEFWLFIMCVCLLTHGQTYPFRLLIWEDAALSTCCEVAVNLEGVPRAALVWINPVLTWKNGKKEQLESSIYDLKSILDSFGSRQSLGLYSLWLACYIINLYCACLDETE